MKPNDANHIEPNRKRYSSVEELIRATNSSPEVLVEYYRLRCVYLEKVIERMGGEIMADLALEFK